MKKFITISLVLIAIGVGVWLYMRSRKITTKAKAMEVIAAYTGAGIAAYETMGESYLIARANAIKQGSETFTDSGMTYVTKTGKSA